MPNMNKTIICLRNWIERHIEIRVIIIIVLLVLGGFEIKAIINDLRIGGVGREPYLSYKNGRLVRVADAFDTNDIQSWMTFGYLNFIFKLPPDYFQKTLNISDSHYPNVQIYRYAQINHLDYVSLMNNIKNAITAYRN